MRRDWGFSRRVFLGSCLAALLERGAAFSATTTGFDPVGFTLRGFTPATVFQRRYRMDATILLLGAPLFTREGAGGGYASVEVSRETDQSARAVALQFAAGSYPARAHGLNRFGILREARVERGEASELAFAGLMTSSREESFEQGRNALASNTGGAEGVVARGRATRASIQAWVDNIDLAPESNWSNLDEVLSDALRREPRGEPRTSPPDSVVTFLHAMRRAALCREPQVRQRFLHAGKPYWLETRRIPEHPLELAGKIHDLAGARRAEFRTAYAAEDESGIPIRIEYRPRSFLRLTFLIEREATQPVIPSVFPQEGA
jgi:hypothetical protein